MIARAVPALVLAGSRPGTDPLTVGTDLPSKALLPIGGQPMLAHVLKSLETANGIGDITVVAQETAPLSADPAIAAASPRAMFVNSTGSIADAVSRAIASVRGPLLVTTADNVLLTPAMIEHFLSKSEGADIAIGLVERAAVAAAGYSTQRTWLRFKAGAWSGANMFRLGGPQVMPLIDFWRALEQDRKKGIKLIAAFGPGLLLSAILRTADIHAFAARAAARFGLEGRIVAMNAAEACIDADKPSDIPVIEAILAARQAPAST